MRDDAVDGVVAAAASERFLVLERCVASGADVLRPGFAVCAYLGRGRELFEDEDDGGVGALGGSGYQGGKDEAA